MRVKGDRNLTIFVYIGILIVGIGLIIFLVTSKPTPTYSDRMYDVLGTVVNIRVAGDKVSSETLLDIAGKELDRIHNKFSTNVESSVVNQLNKNGSLKLDEESLFLFQSSLNLAQITGGAFDPTIRPIIKIWGFDDTKAQKQVPTQKQIEKNLEKVSYKLVEINEEKSTIKFLKEGMEVDLGGIAKGYAVDRVIKRIKQIDPYASGFVEAGGDVGVIGPKNNNLSWVIGLRNPFSSNPYDSVEKIYLKSGAVVTSGNYERYFVEDDVRYHHLIDPKTGYPARGLASVTVISESAMIADAYSTALFIMGFDNPALDYYEEEFGVQSYLISTDNDIRMSDGFDYFLNKGR
ncbi:FAD:protein FMN transferase [Geotoga petraea]|uniref:FAD:protein FMN transferase n=1 Tax=Geotoga petraea TaxID=28234 RepID=A0A1G6MZ14_9BACT|nr:FAD:protein FMN transferase [Geotoga petraea]TGG87290.1 FAD:protein FMN transferase [Geotoga petraea]SDC60809.1 thiamine biosynthesis lipoprotein [Geotoga petraea]